MELSYEIRVRPDGTILWCEVEDSMLKVNFVYRTKLNSRYSSYTYLAIL